MELRHFRYILTIAQEGTISRVALETRSMETAPAPSSRS